MKKKLIMGSLIIYCMALVTAVGFAFARKLGEEKTPNVFLSSKHYNLKIHDKKTEYKNKNLNGKSGDHLQGIIMAPISIVKAINENPMIASR